MSKEITFALDVPIPSVYRAWKGKSLSLDRIYRAWRQSCRQSRLGAFLEQKRSCHRFCSIFCGSSGDRLLWLQSGKGSTQAMRMPNSH